ncbi:hypothetical protein D1643_06880 [Enterorhabdus sp. P55]|nr:hypothetical protein [Enterorhabdus sp. P55]
MRLRPFFADGGGLRRRFFTPRLIGLRACWGEAGGGGGPAGGGALGRPAGVPVLGSDAGGGLGGRVALEAACVFRDPGLASGALPRLR